MAVVIVVVIVVMSVVSGHNAINQT
jgi:hypothetical protein